MPTFPDEGATFGRYRIVRRIGHGGMGQVFEARQDDLDRLVALKVLNQDLALDPTFRQRFVREGRLLASLDSPHVIQVFETGERDGVLFIATQLVKGRDLGRAVTEDGPLSVPRALTVVAQVASALADAHNASLLHRDVKPSNVLLREVRGDVFTYLCDFGIARSADSAETQTSGVLGTLSYMAPECHQGAPASRASDLYALGCVLWAALTGHAPYERTNGYTLGLAHVTEPVPTFTGRTPARDSVNAILARALAKDPADRYAGAADMLADLIEAEEVARGARPGTSDLTGLQHTEPAEGTVRRSTTPPTTVEPQEPRRRPLSPLVVSGAIATLVLAAVVGGAWALGARSGSGDGPGATTATVACWNGKKAASAATCPVPTGRAGMHSVFPTLDRSCREQTRAAVAGLEEAWVCDADDYRIRYERWSDVDRMTSGLDAANPDAVKGIWHAQREVAGPTWSLAPPASSSDLPWRRVSAYRDHPFSLTIEGRDQASRLAGIIKAVSVAAAPSRIGDSPARG